MGLEFQKEFCQPPENEQMTLQSKAGSESGDTFTMGVMNSTRKEGILSSDGQKEWIKLINNPLMWEPS
jgi:hypothetical protein